MKNIMGLLICLLVAFLVRNAWGQGPPLMEYVPGEILVKYKKSTTDIYAKSLLNKIKAQQTQDFSFINVRHLKVLDSKKLPEYLELLRSDPHVEYAEPNYIIRASGIPNDPDFSKLWGLHNTGQTGGTVDADIDAPEAWDIWTGLSNTIIAIIDSGINYTHEDLSSSIWVNEEEVLGDANEDGCPGQCGVDDDGDGLIDEDSRGFQPENDKYINDLINDDDENGYADDIIGWDFANNDNEPLDDNGHGTHVAGIIAAIGDNAKGVVGVNWAARILPLKALNTKGEGTTVDAIAAIQYAIDKGAKVLNNSWGSDNQSRSLREAVMASHKAGALFIAAAGNGSEDNDTTPEYPANYDIPNIVSVAATDHNDNLAYFSNYGTTSVHVAAPGGATSSHGPTPERIYSTYIPPTSYRYLEGTSQATPYVSGLAALIWSNAPHMTNKEVKYNIMATSDPLPQLENKVQSRGRINAYNALTCSHNTLALFGHAPGGNFRVEVNKTTLIKINLTNQCGAIVPQATVNVSFNKGDEKLFLYDDGKHNDSSAADGVYANGWSPQNLGTSTLGVTATKAGFTSSSLSQSGAIVENYRHDDKVAFDWIDTSSGIDTGINKDDGSTIVYIGFNFSFYGNTYSRVRIDSNGYLSFDLQNDPDNDYENPEVLDSSPPNNIIAPFWDDLNSSQTGTIRYQLSGTSPNQVFTVEWHQIPHLVAISNFIPVDTDGNITFEVSLYEASGDIVFRYQDVSFDDPRFDNGLSATVGIENDNGKISHLYFSNSPVLRDQLAIIFFIPGNRPTAKAGSDRVVPTGLPVMLDGSGSSDPDAKELFYSWSLASKPAGSVAAIDDSKKKSPSLKPDIDGVYVASLIVNNGQKQSSPDSTSVRALGNLSKIQVATNKSSYRAGDLLELYLWLGNGASESVIEADVFIGFGFPDGRLFFFDALGNLNERKFSNPQTFTAIAQKISFPATWAFPRPEEMNADIDGNGKSDAYRLYSARLPHLPAGEYFAFAALAQPETTQGGSPELIGPISLAPFPFSE